MDKSIKRRISAWLLLLVYVPIMVAISLHVHTDNGSSAETECVQCANHIHHDGHLDAYSDNVHDCVLCQLASLPYIAPTVVAIAVAVCALHVVYTEKSDCLRLGVCDVKSTRAPPFLVMSYEL